MDEQHTPRMVSLNQALLTELPVDEFEAAVSVERLEDRLELGAANAACIVVYWGASGDCTKHF
jgi:hypothetical protein